MTAEQFSAFEAKFDEVIELMLNNQLRKDLDDTLLEKLLGVLREKFVSAAQEAEAGGLWKGYPIDLFEKGKFPVLLSVVMTSLEATASPELDTQILTFTIHCLGVFVEHEYVFQHLKEKEVLLSFVKVCIKNSTSPFKPSVHAALLSSLTCFSKHVSGLQWLISTGILDAAFSSFTGSSYYVRKDAAAFFTTAFIQWCSLLPAHPNDVGSPFYTCIKRVIALLTRSIPSENCAFIRDCSISILLSSMQQSKALQKLFCEKFSLSERLCEIYKTSSAIVVPSESMIELIAESCLYSQKNLKAGDIVVDIVQSFLKRRFLPSVILLSGKLLTKQHKDETSVSLSQIAVILWPVIIATSMPTSCTVPPEYSEIMKTEMAEKNVCLSLVRVSLATLSQLAHMMDMEAFSDVVKACCKVLLLTDAESPQFYFLSENPKIRISTLQLLSAILEANMYLRLPVDTKTSLIECLLMVTENRSSDFTFTSQALNLIAKCVVLKTEDEDLWSKELLEQFGKILQKNLLDSKWPVVDSALQVVMCAVDHSEDDTWVEFIKSHGIAGLVWDLAFPGDSEGYLKASAIKTVTSMCLKPPLFRELTTIRGASEDLVLSLLCKFANSSDIFIQRECLSCIYKWIENKGEENNKLVHATFTKIMRSSLDMETKLTSLKTWRHISEKLCKKEQRLCLESYVESLCSIGYGFSVLHCLSDHDNSVKLEAIKTLLGLRQILSEMGYSEASLNSENDVPVSSEEESSQPSMDTHVVCSKEEKDAAINDVLNAGTSSHIHSIMRAETTQPEDVSSVALDCSAEHISCCKEEFWKTLWSGEMSNPLSVCTRSSDVYMNDPCALLDDIIAAKVIAEEGRQTEYQQPDCY